MAALPTIQTPELEPRIMADGVASKDVAAELGVHEHTVGKWRRRFLKERCEGLLDEACLGRPRSIGDDQVAAVIERTTPVDAAHWSIRSMAAETGFFHTTIRRMYDAWRTRTSHAQLRAAWYDLGLVGRVPTLPQRDRC